MQAEIEADMNRRLGGNETDLVGYWHFDNLLANDYSKNKQDGKMTGGPTQVASPLPAYKVFAGAQGKFVQSRVAIPAGNLTHLAAVHRQAYGLQFDGDSVFLDCGNAESLNTNTDLTIEAFFQLDDSKFDRGILTRGKLGDGDDQKTPYSISVETGGQIVFAFEDVDGSTASDDITFTVNASPEINAGPDQPPIKLIGGIARAELRGVIRDNGLGDPSKGSVAVAWTRFSGPDTVTIENADQLAALAKFTRDGDYTLQLTLRAGDLTSPDGFLETTDQILIRIRF